MAGQPVYMTEYVPQQYAQQLQEVYAVQQPQVVPMTGPVPQPQYVQQTTYAVPVPTTTTTVTTTVPISGKTSFGIRRRKELFALNVFFYWAFVLMLYLIAGFTFRTGEQALTSIFLFVLASMLLLYTVVYSIIGGCEACDCCCGGGVF
jgi:hypothetical protein